MYEAYALRGMIVAIVLHLATVGTYHAVRYLEEQDGDEKFATVRIMRYSELGPPPSITNNIPLPAIGISSAVKPNIGTPVPVPDAEVNPEQTFASQQELSAVTTPASEGVDKNGGVSVEQDIKIEDDPDMNTFIAVEKMPQVVKSVVPVYPDVAVRSGIEGTVWVKVLVDKEGKPRRAVVIKETPENIFSQSALKAAMEYLFTPAVMNSGPVTVWVTIPFRFQIRKQVL
jgi:TonB family protein